MPQRNNFDLSANQIHYVRRKSNGKVTYIYSPEQLQEMVDDGRITEEDFVGIQISKEGYGGPRGSSKPKLSYEYTITPSSQWSTHNPKNGAEA